MKPHEIERHQAQPHQIQIDLYLDPTLFWFRRPAAAPGRCADRLGDALRYHPTRARLAFS